MSHFALICPPFLGHLNPMRALARELVRRGHRVTVLGLADVEDRIADPSLGFRPIGASTHPAGTLAGLDRRMGAIEGFWGLRPIVRDVAEATAMVCRDAPEAIRAIGADAVIADQAEAGGGLVAAHLGLPFVSVANALPLNREALVPPPFTAWRYDPSRWGRERNLGGYRVSDRLMARHAAVIADHAERWRLGARRTMADCLSPLAQISQTVAAFDVPRTDLPASFHHCGPLREPVPPAMIGLPPDDGRPLVYASLGTLQGARLGIFRRIAEAARRLDLRLVVSHGGRLSPAEAASLPGTPSVHAYVPQEAVLRRASVAVLNGGLNTVMDAMGQGVPVVALPIAFEQGATAARLVRCGAGLRVSRRFLTAGRVAHALERVLSDPLHAESARRIQVAVAAAGGVVRAADIVEAAIRTGRPVLHDPSADGRLRRSAA